MKLRKEFFLTILSRISDVIVSRDLTDKIMMKYHLFKDSPEEEDKLIREEMDRYDAEMSTGTVDAFDDLIDTLELTEDDPEAQLKAKHSKSKKSRKSKRKVSKRKVSKRRKTKRKNKKTKRR